MLNLVPFAGSRRHMADRNGEIWSSSANPWEFDFPEPDLIAITAPRICWPTTRRLWG